MCWSFITFSTNESLSPAYFLARMLSYSHRKIHFRAFIRFLYLCMAKIWQFSQSCSTISSGFSQYWSQFQWELWPYLSHISRQKSQLDTRDWMQQRWLCRGRNSCWKRALFASDFWQSCSDQYCETQSPQKVSLEWLGSCTLMLEQQVSRTRLMRRRRLHNCCFGFGLVEARWGRLFFRLSFWCPFWFIFWPLSFRVTFYLERLSFWGPLQQGYPFPFRQQWLWLYQIAKYLLWAYCFWVHLYHGTKTSSK